MKEWTIRAAVALVLAATADRAAAPIPLAARAVECKIKLRARDGYAVSWILLRSNVRNPDPDFERERPLGLTLLYSFQVDEQASAALTSQGPFGTIVSGGPKGPTRRGYTSASFALSDAKPEANLQLGVQDEPASLFKGTLRIIE